MAYIPTPAEEKAMAEVVKAVLEHPDFVDELAEKIGIDEIATDPSVAALQLINASLLLDDESFDSTIQSFDATQDFDWSNIGEGIKNAASKVGGMFKQGGTGDGGGGGATGITEGSQAATGWFQKIFGGIKDKISNWKDKRQVKKALKNSGDPNWREKWRQYKKTGTIDGISTGQLPGGGTGGTGGTSGLPDWMTGRTGGTGSGTINLSGMTDQQVQELMAQGAAMIEAQAKKIKLWQILTGVAGGLFLVSIVGLIAMRSKLKKGGK